MVSLMQGGRALVAKALTMRDTTTSAEPVCGELVSFG